MSEQNSGVYCGCGRSPSGFCTGLHKLTNEQYQARLAAQGTLTEEKVLLKEEGSKEM